MISQKISHKSLRDIVAKTHFQKSDLDCATTTTEAQRFAYIAAKAFQSGHTLRKDNDGYMLIRWCHFRHCDTLAEAEQRLGIMGVQV
jgi:hypothetical protein